MIDHADRPFPMGLRTVHEKYTETITIRVTKQDLTLLQKICKARGEDASGFLRRAMRIEFAKLGFLSEEEKQALGLHRNNTENPQFDNKRPGQ